MRKKEKSFRVFVNTRKKKEQLEFINKTERTGRKVVISYRSDNATGLYTSIKGQPTKTTIQLSRQNQQKTVKLRSWSPVEK